VAHKDPREPFTRLSVAEAKHMMENGGAQVVDVREGWEYQNGHIPGAEHIPVNTVFACRNELSRDRDIIFVCSVAQRSALACEMAAAAGLTRLYNAEGGTEAWINAGYPVEK
jgi:rhodanese-related sulfurtransferase